MSETDSGFQQSAAPSTAGPSHRIGIRSLLLVLVAISLLPAFVLVVLNYRQDVAEAELSLRTELQTVSVLAQSGQESVVAGVRNILETVASGPSVRRTDIRHLCYEFLANIVARSADFANLGFADVNGDMQCIARGRDQQINVADRKYFQIASAERRFAVAGFIVGRATAVPGMSYSIPVYDYQDRFVGVAFATVNLERVNAALQRVMLRHGLRIDLVDANGVLMGSTAGGLDGVGKPYPAVDIHRSIAGASQAATEVVTQAVGGQWVQIRRVASDAAGGLFVVASVNVAQELNALRERLFQQLLALSGLLAVGLFVAWLLGMFFVARPVLALQRSMDGASSASGTRLTTVRTRTKELDELSLGLRAMIDRLHQRGMQVERAQKLAGVGFYTFDGELNLYQVDASVESMLSLHSEGGEARASLLEGAFLDSDAHALRMHRQLLLAQGGEIRIAMRHLRPDGEPRVIELYELVPDPRRRQTEGKVMFSGAIQDVTEKRRMQRMYALLANVNEACAVARTPEELYQRLCDAAVSVGDFRMAWVAARPTDQGLFHPLARAGDDQGYVQLVSQAAVDVEHSEAPGPAAFRSQNLVVIDDVRQVPQTSWWRNEALQRGYRSIASVPLMFEGKVAAVAIFMAGNPNHFQTEERRLLVALAASVSTALSHQRVRSERERVHHELVATTSSLLRAQSLARLGNWSRNTIDGTAVWSFGLYEILGRSPSLGPPSVEDARRNLDPDHVDAYLAYMHAALHGLPWTQRMRYRCRREDGQWLWLEEILDEPVRDSDGRVVRVSGTVQDITDQVQGEQQLQLQLSRTELLNQIARATEARHDLKSVSQVMCEQLEANFDVDVSVVLLRGEGANTLAVEHIGSRGRDLANKVGLRERAVVDVGSTFLGRSFNASLIYQADLADREDALSTLMAQAGLGSVVVVPLQTSGELFGVILVARSQSHAFTDGECGFLGQLGEQVSLAAVHARLIESLKKAYQDLELAQQTALQQERLRLLGQMASGIAHDINNAITPVSLYAEMLLAHENDISEHGRGQLETIQLAVHNVMQTIARMRDFYRPTDQSLGRHPVDPNSLVTQALDLTKTRWRDESQMQGAVVEVITDFADACPSILGFEVEIRDAVVNLILNAVDAMPGGGRLSLRTRVVSQSGTRRVVIEVSDTGVGMDEQTRLRAIEPFFTTKGDQGSGLGLAMVYGCMRRHEGELLLDSQPGAGTRVALHFPIAQGNPPAAPEPALPERARSSGKRLLLIDDDPLVLKAISSMLHDTGHEVVTAAGGEHGLAAFEEHLHGQPFDLVLTDLGMPGLDGRQVALRIKAMSPATPVVMLTGWGRRMEEDGDIPAHVDRLLGKPLARKDLLLAIDELTSAA